MYASGKSPSPARAYSGARLRRRRRAALRALVAEWVWMTDCATLAYAGERVV